MTNTDIARKIATETGVSRAQAADQLDEMVTSILKTVKRGGAANVPGLGQFRRTVKGALKFTPAHNRSGNGPK